MNPAHLHLILVHIPVIMVPVGCALLLFGMRWKNIPIQATAHSFFVVGAVVTVAAYLLGEGAEEIVEDLAGVLESAIEDHEAAAELALWFTVFLGIAAASMLAAFCCSIVVRQKIQLWVLGVAIVSTGMLGYSAQLGGMIRHPEAFEKSASLRDRGRIHDEPRMGAYEKEND